MESVWRGVQARLLCGMQRMGAVMVYTSSSCSIAAKHCSSCLLFAEHVYVVTPRTLQDTNSGDQSTIEHVYQHAVLLHRHRASSVSTSTLCHPSIKCKSSAQHLTQ